MDVIGLHVTGNIQISGENTTCNFTNCIIEDLSTVLHKNISNVVYNNCIIIGHNGLFKTGEIIKIKYSNVVLHDSSSNLIHILEDNNPNDFSLIKEKIYSFEELLTEDSLYERN